MKRLSILLFSVFLSITACKPGASTAPSATLRSTTTTQQENDDATIDGFQADSTQTDNTQTDNTQTGNWDSVDFISDSSSTDTLPATDGSDIPVPTDGVTASETSAILIPTTKSNCEAAGGQWLLADARCKSETEIACEAPESGGRKWSVEETRCLSVDESYCSAKGGMYNQVEKVCISEIDCVARNGVWNAYKKTCKSKEQYDCEDIQMKVFDVIEGTCSEKLAAEIECDGKGEQYEWVLDATTGKNICKLTFSAAKAQRDAQCFEEKGEGWEWDNTLATCISIVKRDCLGKLSKFVPDAPNTSSPNPGGGVCKKSLVELKGPIDLFDGQGWFGAGGGKVKTQCQRADQVVTATCHAMNMGHLFGAGDCDNGGTSSLYCSSITAKSTTAQDLTESEIFDSESIAYDINKDSGAQINCGEDEVIIAICVPGGRNINCNGKAVGVTCRKLSVNLMIDAADCEEFSAGETTLGLPSGPSKTGTNESGKGNKAAVSFCARHPDGGACYAKGQGDGGVVGRGPTIWTKYCAIKAK